MNSRFTGRISNWHVISYRQNVSLCWSYEDYKSTQVSTVMFKIVLPHKESLAAEGT